MEEQAMKKSWWELKYIPSGENRKCKGPEMGAC